MTASTVPNREPGPLGGPIPFEEADFYALSGGLDRDPQYDDRRLAARRKLAALGRAAAARIRGLEGGPDLEVRSSLHHPHAFNRMRVRRLWTYVTRTKKAKQGLRRVLGRELGADLDAAYRNAYLCVAIEAEALEVSLRIHPDAWCDGQNLKNRVEREGLSGWLEQLNRLGGYRLQLDDWKGEWVCGELDSSRLEEFLRYYVPGELGLAVVQMFPAPAADRGPAFEEDVPGRLIDEIVRLVPLYRYTAWSSESDFLFNS